MACAQTGVATLYMYRAGTIDLITRSMWYNIYVSSQTGDRTGSLAQTALRLPGAWQQTATRKMHEAEGSGLQLLSFRWPAWTCMQLIG